MVVRIFFSYRGDQHEHSRNRVKDIRKRIIEELNGLEADYSIYDYGIKGKETDRNIDDDLLACKISNYFVIYQSTNWLARKSRTVRELEAFLKNNCFIKIQHLIVTQSAHEEEFNKRLYNRKCDILGYNPEKYPNISSPHRPVIDEELGRSPLPLTHPKFNLTVAKEIASNVNTFIADIKKSIEDKVFIFGKVSVEIDFFSQEVNRIFKNRKGHIYSPLLVNLPELAKLSPNKKSYYKQDKYHKEKLSLIQDSFVEKARKVIYLFDDEATKSRNDFIELIKFRKKNTVCIHIGDDKEKFDKTQNGIKELITERKFELLSWNDNDKLEKSKLLNDKDISAVGAILEVIEKAK